jgi:hypothetical protein
MSMRVTGSSSASKIAGDVSTVIGVTDSVSDTFFQPRMPLSRALQDIGVTLHDLIMGENLVANLGTGAH